MAQAGAIHETHVLTDSDRIYIDRLFAGDCGKEAFKVAKPGISESYAEREGPRLRREPRIAAEIARIQAEGPEQQLARDCRRLLRDPSLTPAQRWQSSQTLARILERQSSKPTDLDALPADLESFYQAECGIGDPDAS